jgi:hypothetical protein
MAERKVPEAPVVRTPVVPEPDNREVVEPETKEYDGQGSRLDAVRHGKVDAELVYNGLSTVPLVEQVKDENHTGNFVAVSRIEGEKLILPGAVVEGLSDEQLRPLISSGAVRRETKEEARDTAE